MPPDISIVVVTPTDFGQIRETIQHLLDQTVHDQMELIVVAESREALGPDTAELDGFPTHQVVEAGPIVHRGQAAAKGVRVAQAPIVAMVEEHAYPEPGYAEALLSAHEGPWAGVSPVIRNANPESAVSWSNYYPAYLALTEPVEAGEVDNVAWHNTAYKRDRLLAFGDRLGALLDFEGDLLTELRAQGHRLYLEPRAQVRHMNIEKLWAATHLLYLQGRLTAASRVEGEGWPLWRRLLYVAGSPLTPLMYLPNLWRGFRRTKQPVGRVLRALPSLSVSLGAVAVGEVVGLLRGATGAKHRMEAYELNRDHYLSRRTLAQKRSSSPPRV
ncbi:hypothetical protein [Rubrivirga sp. IMCC43871]|uniref:hypothetical protein n=1 Tax=Rubrivirga sp. IMCC43871 TaxID=3391575 RepID=UPI00398FD891